MKPIKNVELSFRCKEDIGKMTPCLLGLHCSSCNKTVIDFRKSNLLELTNALENHEKVCGIFTNEQIAQKVKSPSILKRLAASFLFSIGLGTLNNNLFSQSACLDTSQYNLQLSNQSVWLGEVTAIPIPATFKNGGDKGLRLFIKENLRCPDNVTEGKVIVSFTVNTNGKTTKPRIVQGLSELADKEVLRVVKLLEFIPETHNGEKVQTRFELPIYFKRN